MKTAIAADAGLNHDPKSADLPGTLDAADSIASAEAELAGSAPAFSRMSFSIRDCSVCPDEKLPEQIPFTHRDDAAEVIFQSISVKSPQQSKNGKIILFNSHVYAGGRPRPWDVVFEVRVPVGQTVQVDLGVGVLMPVGCVLQLVPNPDLYEKFGLRLVSPLTIGREDAVHPVILEFQGCTDTAYVAKNQSLVSCKIIKQVG